MKVNKVQVQNKACGDTSTWKNFHSTRSSHYPTWFMKQKQLKSSECVSSPLLFCRRKSDTKQKKKITSKIAKIVNLELIEIFPDRGAERLRHEGKGGWVHREPGLVAGRGRSHYLLGCRNGSSTTWRNFLHQVWSLAQRCSTLNCHYILFLDTK